MRCFTLVLAAALLSAVSACSHWSKDWPEPSSIEGPAAGVEVYGEYRYSAVYDDNCGHGLSGRFDHVLVFSTQTADTPVIVPCNGLFALRLVPGDYEITSIISSTDNVAEMVPTIFDRSYTFTVPSDRTHPLYLGRIERAYPRTGPSIAVTDNLAAMKARLPAGIVLNLPVEHRKVVKYFGYTLEEWLYAKRPAEKPEFSVAKPLTPQIRPPGRRFAGGSRQADTCTPTFTWEAQGHKYLSYDLLVMRHLELPHYTYSTSPTGQMEVNSRPFETATKVVYSAEHLTTRQHTLPTPLAAGGEYEWTVRGYFIDKGVMVASPWAAYNDIPNIAYSQFVVPYQFFRFSTPASCAPPAADHSTKNR